MIRLLLFFAIAFATASAHAQVDQLLSREAARRFGLERMWFTQVAVDPGRGHIEHVVQHISNTEARFIYEVFAEGESVQFTSTDLDAFGLPIGQEGAKERAEKLATSFRNQGRTVDVIEHAIPQITLVISTDRGSVDVIDAETGKRFWSTYVGDPDHPTLAPAVDDYHVAVVNGSYVHLLDRKTGELVWRRRSLNVPGAGPGLNQQFVFVPMLNGALESYSVNDPSLAISQYRAVGNAVVQPLVTRRSVVWPTDRGYLYVAPAERVGIRFRIEAKKSIVATPAHAGRNLYIPSVDGYIYCVDELTGGMLWTISIGEALNRRPVAVSDRLYVPSVEQNLYCLSPEDGSVLWSAAGIDQILTVGTDRIFCVGSGNNLVALDRESGSVLMSGIERLPEFRVTNVASNRLFLASPRGLLQGFREVGQPLPTVHFPAEAEQAAEGQQQAGAEPGAIPEGETEPMTTATDPFNPEADIPSEGEAGGLAPATVEPEADANPFGPE